MTVPRIRGTLGQALEGEHKDKWFYEISIWDLSGEHRAGDPFQFGPFETEIECKEAGREIVKAISQKLEKSETGEVSGKYFDLKNGGVMRPWEDQ